MIRIVLVDDHPALRAGLHTVLRAEPGLIPVGQAANAAEAEAVVDSFEPDVVVLDYHLPDDDGLLLCRRLKARQNPPAVLIFSAYAEAPLALPAIVAGADGIASKSAPANELFEAIRLVASGRPVLPPVGAELMREAGEKLDEERELPVFGMLVERTAPAEVAQVLGVDESEIVDRTRSIIAKLRREAALP